MGTTESRLPYFKQVNTLAPVVSNPPVCLYLETTNRCNLLCQHCPRTFASVERPADLSFEKMKMIVEQVPNLKQAVLHGIGEPLINKELPQIIRYLKDRGVYVLFNSNGTMLYPHIQKELIESGLDEYRVSLDAADAETFAKVRGLPRFNLIVKNVREFVALKKERGVENPKLSLWLVGMKETLEELNAFVRLARDMGVGEVYLQRLVFFEDGQHGQGLARSDQALFGAVSDEEAGLIAGAHALADEIGVAFHASGAASPEQSLMPRDSGQPWSLCRRPWTLMYITANGNVLPCCISPFAERDYDSLILGNVFERPLMDIWNDHLYRKFRDDLQSDHPPSACRNCGVRWSL
ncbi:MAG TPA: radical SAM protein [Blastocatellia bacterium]|nr:radical SAM protein [Blastocatellia bacterium]